jgi:hypothetical protein
MAENAKSRAIDAGIAEMNGREALAWGNRMLAVGEWKDVLPESDLGNDYDWTTPANLEGGGLTFQKGLAIDLTRTESTVLKPATWTRKKG